MTSSSATSTARRRAPVELAATAVGAVFLLVGILGFIPGITTDYDQTDDTKPTLKKRQPDATDSPDGASGGDSTSTPDSGPPKLKKRDQSEDAQPAASPSPGQ